jgi:hypothetical protein
MTSNESDAPAPSEKTEAAAAPAPKPAPPAVVKKPDERAKVEPPKPAHHEVKVDETAKPAESSHATPAPTKAPTAPMLSEPPAPSPGTDGQRNHMPPAPPAPANPGDPKVQTLEAPAPSTDGQRQHQPLPLSAPANPGDPQTPKVVFAKEPIAASVDQNNLLHELDRYAFNMGAGKVISSDAGATYQQQLFNSIMGVLKRPGTEFVPLWTTLLGFAHAHKDDVFNPRYLFRFFTTLRLAGDDLRNFERILNLIRATADPQMRATGLKQVDMATVLQYMPSPVIISNVRAYYGA